MNDDGKRSELICCKVTERMALDVLRLATNDDRSVSDFLFNMLRLRLYGDIERLNNRARQVTSIDKVDR